MGDGVEDPESQREAIRAEASRIHESAVFSAQGQFEAAKRWRLVHWGLAVLAAGLSSGTAVFTFADGAQAWSAVLAVLAAISTTVLASARPDRLAERAQVAGTGYTTLRNDVRRFHGITVPQGDPQDLAGELDALADRAAALDQSADPVPRWAYERARKNIEHDGGQAFEADV
ncbi:SLATT domain-containing protein [Micrococcus porci]|uniref:SLATT domain-containing protein n=1 Tax=Micrococcus porci TaxID=2856555 RepID=UPI001CCA7E0C|nr:SLATT domain-containing protein [Micrococcus porci]UBH25199.1 SLATT domain-containing protein [Micrococcus porci]